MDMQQLKSLIRQGEGTQIEFKKTLTHLPKVAKTLAAFANNRGGTILVGVEDNRSICGVNPDEESFMVMQAARDWCFPPIDLALVEEEVEGATVLLVQVAESSKKPHQARNKANEWITYVRADDKCIVADQNLEKQIKALPPADEREEKLVFSKNEQAVFSLLKSGKKFTLKEYAKSINIGKQRATKILVELVKEGILFEKQEGKSLVYLAAVNI